jgi:flagellar basal body-associated protein FliL
MVIQSKVGSVLLIMFAVLGVLALLALLGMVAMHFGMMGMMNSGMGDACRSMMSSTSAGTFS